MAAYLKIVIFTGGKGIEWLCLMSHSHGGKIPLVSRGQQGGNHGNGTTNHLQPFPSVPFHLVGCKLLTDGISILKWMRHAGRVAMRIPVVGSIAVASPEAILCGPQAKFLSIILQYQTDGVYPHNRVCPQGLCPLGLAPS
jgi:hypothetical protein